MNFHWINWINLLAVMCLILINIIASRKGLSGSLNSKHWVANILEQIGRYGCMAFMIFPIFTRGWEFGFASVTEMLIWLCSTPLLLVIYGVLWTKKSHSGAGILYVLAIVPAALFLLNGILLRHPALVVVSLFFGICHFIIVRENTAVIFFT